MPTQTKETQDQITPEIALQLLKDGNHRFTHNNKRNRDLLGQVKQTATGQYPFASVVGCIDSRVPNETIFDQGEFQMRLFLTKVSEASLAQE